MRLTDLLHPHLDGVTTVVDATRGALSLEPYLHLPPVSPCAATRNDPSPRGSWPSCRTDPEPSCTAARTPFTRCWRGCGPVRAG